MFKEYRHAYPLTDKLESTRIVSKLHCFLRDLIHTYSVGRKRDP